MDCGIVDCAGTSCTCRCKNCYFPFFSASSPISSAGFSSAFSASSSLGVRLCHHRKFLVSFLELHLKQIGKPHKVNVPVPSSSSSALPSSSPASSPSPSAPFSSLSSSSDRPRLCPKILSLPSSRTLSGIYWVLGGVALLDLFREFNGSERRIFLFHGKAGGEEAEEQTQEDAQGSILPNSCCCSSAPSKAIRATARAALLKFIFACLAEARPGKQPEKFNAENAMADTYAPSSYYSYSTASSPSSPSSSSSFDAVASPPGDARAGADRLSSCVNVAREAFTGAGAAPVLAPVTGGLPAPAGRCSTEETRVGAEEE
eukprot:GHVT01028214.1.p1 GENE.GHVT01028214.1~~GHVT01028214.1.p1  ORF type:complete len:364 (+),score=92.18 GHVT01028214.1:145-1092(+)